MVQAFRAGLLCAAFSSTASGFHTRLDKDDDLEVAFSSSWQLYAEQERDPSSTLSMQRRPEDYLTQVLAADEGNRLSSIFLVSNLSAEGVEIGQGGGSVSFGGANLTTFSRKGVSVARPRVPIRLASTPKAPLAQLCKRYWDSEGQSKKVPSFYCNMDSVTGTELQEGHELALDHIELDPSPALLQGKPVKVACSLHTSAPRRHNLKASYAAWGQYCDDFLPFSNENFKDKNFATTKVDFDKHPPVFPVMIEMLKAISANQNLDFDFLTVGEDDSFWIVENLRHLLTKYYPNPRKTGYYLGRRMAMDGDTNRAFNAAAGFVLSRRAVELLAESCAPKPAFSADVQIADCLAAHNIFPVDTRPGGEGPEVFHTFDARSASDIDYSQEGWLRTYMAPFGHTTHESLEQSISPQSVLFHYVRGNVQILYHNRLYGHPRQKIVWEHSKTYFADGLIPMEGSPFDPPPPLFAPAQHFEHFEDPDSDVPLEGLAKIFLI